MQYTAVHYEAVQYSMEQHAAVQSSHLDTQLHVVGEDQRAEGQGVRADGGEQDAWHLQWCRVHAMTR